MQIDIYIDTTEFKSEFESEDFRALSDKFTSAFSEWVASHANAAFLFSPNAETPKEDLADANFGLSLTLSRKQALKDPLNLLYRFAKEQQLEFVIAMRDPESNESEDVCYFGFEEGRPDVYEVANYLGL